MNIDEIIDAVDAKRCGNGWSGYCPAHDDNSPSLSIAKGDDGSLLIYCHARCTFEQIMDALRDMGVGDNSAYHSGSNKWGENVEYTTETACYYTDKAREIWHTCQPAKGTRVEQYLRARGFNGKIPPILRSGIIRNIEMHKAYPAMVAGITVVPSNKVVAIHRTFLSWDKDEKAPVPQPKMCLGPVKGGAIRLAKPRRKLAIAEGIETALSIMEAKGIPAWAAISAGGIEDLLLPRHQAHEVIICADNDKSGAGQRAAENAARRWMAEGRKVKIVMPRKVGQDFNDLLRE